MIERDDHDLISSLCRGINLNNVLNAIETLAAVADACTAPLKEDLALEMRQFICDHTRKAIRTLRLPLQKLWGKWVHILCLYSYRDVDVQPFPAWPVTEVHVRGIKLIGRTSLPIETHYRSELLVVR